MKILHLVTGLDLGDGIVEVVLGMTGHGTDDNRRDIVPMVCGLRGGGRYEQFFRDKGIPVFIFDLGAPNDRWQYLRAFPVIWKLRRLLKREQIDVVHGHNFFAGLIGLSAAAGMEKMHRVLTMHGYLYFEGWTRTRTRAAVRKSLLRMFFSKWERIVGVSGAVCRWVAGFGSGAPLACIHNGIRPDRFPQSSEGDNYRRRWGIPNDARLIGTVGVLEEIKGGAELLQAAANVLRTVPDAYFVFIGGRPPYEAETDTRWRALAQNLGIAQRVIFTDRIDDIANALAALDLFVFCSAAAGFGLAVAEAMRMEKPVIATRIGGIPELVEDGVSGWLIPPHDPVSLAQAILGALADPERSAVIARVGRRRVEDNFLAGRMAREYQTLYLKLEGRVLSPELAAQAVG